MFKTSDNHAAELQRLQDMAVIHCAAKRRAKQLKREAMNAFFAEIFVRIRKTATFVFNIGK